jgi:hydroxymethylbilane synthase
MRLATRRSALALAQAELVSRELGGCELVPIVTGGDMGAPAQDKSRWVDELERALLDGRADLAVHSAKDLPGELADGLVLAGAPPRGAAEDVLCGAGELQELPAGARVGTSSIRRVAQLRAAREDLELTGLRGNVDTRLALLADPQNGLQAIVLARAGLVRLGREQSAAASLDPGRFVPAPGQGTLALEARAGDEAAEGAARAISDPDAFASLLAERALARELGADCHTPLGAWASAAGEGKLHLRAWIGLPDGSAWVSDELCGGSDDPQALAGALAQRLRSAGADAMLLRAAEMAGV